MHALYPLLLGALLFAIGLYGVLARRNAITILMAIELLLNAVTINLVAFSALLRDTLDIGQVFTLFVITIAAAETGLGLAIVLLIYRQRGTASVDEQRRLAEPLGGPADETRAYEARADENRADENRADENRAADRPTARFARAPQTLETGR